MMLAVEELRRDMAHPSSGKISAKPQEELPGLGKFLLEVLLAVVVGGLAVYLTGPLLQIILGVIAMVAGFLAKRQRIIHWYVLPFSGACLLLIGLWRGYIYPPPPPHFAGRIKEVYEQSLTADQRKQLGRFVGDTYLYPQTGCQYVLFDHGLAVYFRAEKETNPQSRGDRSFFLAVREYKGSSVSFQWMLAVHRQEQEYFRRLGKDLEDTDRCHIFPQCREPVSGIGSVWRSVQEVKDKLGDALSCEESYWIKIQEFSNGYLIIDVPAHNPHCVVNVRQVNTNSFLLLKEKIGIWDGVAEQVDQSSRGISPGDEKRLPVWTCTSEQQTCQDESHQNN